MGFFHLFCCCCWLFKESKLLLNYDFSFKMLQRKNDVHTKQIRRTHFLLLKKFHTEWFRLYCWFHSIQRKKKQSTNIMKQQFLPLFYPNSVLFIECRRIGNTKCIYEEIHETNKKSTAHMQNRTKQLSAMSVSVCWSISNAFDACTVRS